MRSGTLNLSLLVMLGCGPGLPNAIDTVLVKERPELTEAEYRLYRGTGEDVEEREDLALFGATAVGLLGSAPGPAPLLAVSVVIPDRPVYEWNSPSAARVAVR